MSSPRPLRRAPFTALWPARSSAPADPPSTPGSMATRAATRAATRRRRLAGAALLAGGAVTLSACSQGTAADYVVGGPVNPPLSFSARTHTVSLYLRASDPHGSSPFNFDGASAGHMTITVPVGWRVDATCANESTILTHSCAIVDKGTTTLAFNGSAVPDPVRGVKQGSAETFSFVASRAGTYQLVCLVPGHREAGMWDWFQVRSGGVPTITGAVS